MKNIVIGGRGTNEKYRSLSNFLENFRQIALFVLSCKKIKFLRDICDFNSYISYGGNLRSVAKDVELSRISSKNSPFCSEL